MRTAVPRLSEALRRGWRWLRLPILIGAGALAATASALFVAVYLVPIDPAPLSPDGGPLVLTDRYGTPLRSVPGERPGRQAWVRLDDIPAAAVLAVIESEDHRFFAHRGVDSVGVVRAAWLNLRGGRIAYGGSTITMQLARMLHGTGDQRTVVNKVRESVMALRLERALDKRLILEHYLNRAYYGNGAYGIEAAAQLYFGKPAAALSLAEATLVAIIPRAPSGYDPLRHREATLRRRDYVLGLLVQRGHLNAEEVEAARAQPLVIAHHRPAFVAPHFTEWLLVTLPPEVRRRGGVVRTSLDLPLQQALERRVAEHAAGLRAASLQQAGVILLDTATGEVLAMVGSAGFDETDGQINIVARRRHPGSALKPFVYALALDSGATPASIAYDIHDVPSEYRVVGLTQPERGPVRYREALAGSYNLAAVHVLERVGVARLMSLLASAGVGADRGAPADYGLRLALGSAKVRLVDLAAAYTAFARGGVMRPAGGVLEVALPDGTTWRPAPSRDRRLMSPATGWLIMDMLADPEARRTAFGQELPLDLPFRVAAKTGTSRGFADTVAVATTREFTAAAWAGNFDGTPTQGLVAMHSAAPLVRDALLLAAERGPLTLPDPPAEVVTAEVCALSGMRPGAACPHRKREHFAHGTVPRQPCTWHRHDDGHLTIAYPAEASAWAERQRTRGGRQLTR